MQIARCYQYAFQSNLTQDCLTDAELSVNRDRTALSKSSLPIRVGFASTMLLKAFIALAQPPLESAKDCSTCFNNLFEL